MMNAILKDNMGMIIEVYIDDVVIKFEKYQGYLEHLQTSINKIPQHNMHLNPRTCTFRLVSTEFQGYLMTR